MVLFSDISFVIPGRAAGASPESITPELRLSYYVYLLASGKHGTLYVGVTRDLVRRVHEHKTKATPGFTARLWRRPLGLVRDL